MKHGFNSTKELAGGEACPKCRSRNIQPFIQAAISGFDRLCRGCGHTWNFYDRFVEMRRAINVSEEKLKAPQTGALQNRIVNKLHFGKMHLTKKFAEAIAGFIIQSAQTQ